MATTARVRTRFAASRPEPPQVSARAHNAILDAAQERVDRLEPRLASIIEVILRKAGTRAADLFHERATRNVVPDASLVAAAANSDVAKTSTMIALKPRPSEAAALAQDGGDPPEILHVTLAYLGDSDQPLSEIADALKPVAATHAPISGVVGGVGVFHPAGVGIVLPDARGLTETRQGVVQALTDAGIDYGRDHGFTPHITINGDGEPPDLDAAGQPLHFDSLHIVRGNDEEIELPLVGVRALTAAGPDWSPPFADELINVDALVQQILDKTDPVRRALIEETMTPALEQAGLSFDVSNPLTAKLLADTASQVTNIAMTTRANLMDIIGKSYQNGLTIPATRDLIRQGMHAASKTRATMIARTEMARAVNGGSLAATQLVEQATGQNYNKVWHTAPGARYPRHELYVGLDGQTVGSGDAFNVGGDELQYPGDPDGEPGETINCRCTLSYTEVRATGVSTPGAAPEPIADVLTAPLIPLTDTQDVDTLVADLRKRADQIEPGVTPIMKAAAQSAGGKLVGLSFKQKTAKSAVRKIISDAADRGITPREDAYDVSDMLRYTAVFSPDQYLAGTQSILDDLASHGFKIDRVRNTWSKDVNYAGINTRILAPNGYRFELQFHTPESFNLKNTTQHVLYEQYRKLDPASDEARALDREMNQNVRNLDFPPDVEGWEYHPAAPPAPPEVAPAPPPESSGAPRSVDIGITPFRAGEDNAVGFYDSAKYKQFITDINASAKAYGVKVDGIDKVTGVWEGDLEPSVSLRVHADNEIAHSKPPPIDFADATPEQRDRIQQAVDEAYARLDQAGVSQDWSRSATSLEQAHNAPPRGIYRPPSKIEVVHKGPDYTAEYRTDTNTIELNVDSRLFPADKYQADAIAKGDIPEFLSRDLADDFVHEYGHAVQDYVGFDGNIAWRGAWNKLTESKAALPSKYAATEAREAFAETFTGLVDGYPQGAAFQEAMRPLLQDTDVFAKPEDSEAYRGQHTAPDRESGAPMYDLTQNDNAVYPDDVYDQSKQVHLYGQGGDKESVALDQEAFNVINSVKGDPTAMVTVYRAVPADVTTINPGDWVTPVKQYADHHAESNLGQDAEGHVVSMQVPAAQLFTNGDSIEEWGWDPPGRAAFDAEARFKAYVSNLGQAYNQDGVILFEPRAAAPAADEFGWETGGKTLYRGLHGDNAAAAAEASRSGELGGGDYGKGIYLARQPQSAVGYAKTSAGDTRGIVLRARLADDAKVATETDLPKGLAQNKAADWAKENGYDAYSSTNYVVVVNPAAVVWDATNYSTAEVTARTLIAQGYEQTAREEYPEIASRIAAEGSGNSVMATFAEPLPEGKVIDAMKHAGISGGRFTTDGRLQIIGPATVDYANQIKQLSQELGGIKLDTGSPRRFYEAMHSYTGPGSSYFSDVAGFTDTLTGEPEQIRTIFQGFATDVSEALDVPVSDVDDHVQMQLQKAFIDASRDSIKYRDLPEQVTVYGNKPDPGEVQSFFLKPRDGLQPYTVNRDDILVDMDAFQPETQLTPAQQVLHPEKVTAPEATNEVLIRGDKVAAGAVEQDTTNLGAYTVARGDFSMLDRDNGDYRKALDAFSNPKGVTAFNVPAEEPPPVVETPRGDPIMGTTPEIRKALAEGKGASTLMKAPGEDIVEDPAVKKWLDGLAEQDKASDAEFGAPSPIGDISQWGQYGSRDINAYLSGKTPDLEQYGSEDDVEAAANRMVKLVDSAPPLPPGTTLYRAVHVPGETLSPGLREKFAEIEKDVMARDVGRTPVSELADRLSGFEVTETPDEAIMPARSYTMTVKNGAGDPVGAISYGTLNEVGVGKLPYIKSINMEAKYDDDYHVQALLAKLYVDQDFNALVWDNFDTLDQAKQGVEMAVKYPSWNLLRVGTKDGVSQFWSSGDELSVDSLAFANLGESAKMELGSFIDKAVAAAPNAAKEIKDAQMKALADWAQQKYPKGSYVAMNEPGELASLTTSPDFAASFTNPNEPGLVFRVVNAKTGAPIWPYTPLSEREVLAPPDTMYRVRDISINPMQAPVGSFDDVGKTSDKVVVTLEEAPKCGPLAASLVAATGVACTNIAQYVPKGDAPVTAATDDLFPGQDTKVADHAAAAREAAIVRYAGENNMTVEEYRAAADQVVKSYIAEHPQVRIRVTHQALESILQDGRFKSEFEMPGITGDDTEGRSFAEENMFGYPVGLNPTERPIYGYLAGTADETGIVQEYGDIIVNLDPSVNARATFSIGDSYTAGINGDLSPSLLSSPGIGSWDGSFDIVKAWNEGDIGQISRYVEVEIHGGLPASEIGGITPDEALIVSREDAQRVKDATEAITELAANYKGTQQESQQVEQSGLPADKPQTIDVYDALTQIAKNASLREGALGALIARVGLKGVAADDFVDFAAFSNLVGGNV